jgi:hypothetical protein
MSQSCGVLPKYMLCDLPYVPTVVLRILALQIVLNLNTGCNPFCTGVNSTSFYTGRVNGIVLPV